MGEAKRREAAGQNITSVKRGLIISNPMTIDGTSIFIKSTDLDSQELRHSLLYWDQLVWPSSRGIYIEGGPDSKFLQSAGILSRPDYTIDGDQGLALAAGFIKAFQDAEGREPGQWALAQGDNSILLKNEIFTAGNGLSVDLVRSIPVPNVDVPLAEILEFKQKRRDELGRIREKLDSFSAEINRAEDQHGAFAAVVDRLDKACADAMKVGKEWRFPMRLSNVKASFELRPFQTLAGFIAGFTAGGSIGMPLTAAAIGAATATAPCLKIAGDIGLQGIRPKTGPFHYVYQYHREIF